MAIKRPDLNSEKLCILLDTEFLNRANASDLNSLQKLLKYKNTDNLEMIRTPGETEIHELLDIPYYVEEVDSKNEFSTIKINQIVQGIFCRIGQETKRIVKEL